jgi:hypothetical protein
MPRQIFGEVSQQRAGLAPVRTAARAAPPAEQLRRRRSPAYLSALASLDGGGRIVDRDKIAELREAISAEFPPGAGMPLGWVAKCYLGPPYQVHILDLAGGIVEHYRGSDPLPGLLEQARSLAAGGRYAFVEVYPDKLVAVAADGATSVCDIRS